MDAATSAAPLPQSAVCVRGDREQQTAGPLLLSVLAFLRGRSKKMGHLGIAGLVGEIQKRLSAGHRGLL